VCVSIHVQQGACCRGNLEGVLEGEGGGKTRRPSGHVFIIFVVFFVLFVLLLQGGECSAAFRLLLYNKQFLF